MPAAKKTLLLVGTCIAPAIRYLLNTSPGFARNFTVNLFFTNRHRQFMGDFNFGEEELHSAEAIFYHTPGWADWGNDQAYVDLIARIPAHVGRLSFPYPVFLPLWPFHQGDPRNEDPDRGRHRDDRPWHFPYGDSVVLGLLRQGLTPEQVVARYAAMDLAAMVDLDALLAKSIEIQEAKENETDVKILDFVLSEFRERRVFSTMNHVANASLIHMANQMLRFLGCAPLPAALPAMLRELVMPQMPVHPSVVRHFDLSWAPPDLRYEVDEYQQLTFAEYIYQYAAYSPGEVPP
jgi:hypothetical protein